MGTLFSSLDIGRGGLSTAQIQLDVTGHNIASANKVGFSRQRADDYRRVVTVARQPRAEIHAAVVSQSLVAAIEGDRSLARQAIERVLPLIDGPIRAGHATFGHDLALCALAYDLAFDAWTDAERARFHSYFNRTVDANLRSETHVFHNGWYGYKQWGIGLAGYACYHENPRAPAILAELERDYRERAAPALDLAGAGGGWAEGYYIHYWLYEWLWFCEVARRCEGTVYLALAPRFYSARAVSSIRCPSCSSLRVRGSRMRSIHSESTVRRTGSAMVGSSFGRTGGWFPGSAPGGAAISMRYPAAPVRLRSRRRSCALCGFAFRVTLTTM